MEKTKEAVEDLARRFKAEREIYAPKIEGQLQQLESRVEDLKRQVATARS